MITVNEPIVIGYNTNNIETKLIQFMYYAVFTGFH